MADGGNAADYYPENQSPFRASLEVISTRFAAAREAILLEYEFATAAAYWGDLDDLLWWCAHEEVNVLTPSTSDISRYLSEMADNGYSPNTIARRLTSFRIFYDHLVAEGSLTESPVNGLHQLRPRKSAPKRRLRQTQRDRLLARATESGVRDETLVRLVLDGVAIGAICACRAEALEGTDTGSAISVVYRGVPRTVVLGAEATAAIRRCLGERSEGPLFANRAGNPMSRFDVLRVLHRVGDAARVRGTWW